MGGERKREIQSQTDAQKAYGVIQTGREKEIINFTRKRIPVCDTCDNFLTIVLQKEADSNEWGLNQKVSELQQRLDTQAAHLRE